MVIISGVDSGCAFLFISGTKWFGANSKLDLRNWSEAEVHITVLAGNSDNMIL